VQENVRKKTDRESQGDNQMPKIPQSVLEAWKLRDGPAVLSTVGENSLPNSIYVSCVELYDDSIAVIADNYFDKTRANILNGSKGSLLFITEDHKAFQIKGSITYHTSGPIFNNMKSWNPKDHPGHAAAALTADEVYSGAERLL
jgi:uncharacterized protein